MPLNKNNFLRWTGAFVPASFTLTTEPIPVPTIYANEDSATCLPFTSIVSSIGIDYTSLKIITVLNGDTFVPITLVEPIQWDSDTQTLTLFRPIAPYTWDDYLVVFSFADLLGNTVSSEMQVNLSTIYTSWAVYPISTVCLLDSFGNNTGYQSWSQLQLINMSTSDPIIPLVLADNIPSNPNYIPPVQNFTLCPAPGAGTGLYSPLVIANFSENSGDPNNFITITNIYLSSTTLGPGSTPFTTNIPCNIPPGQSARFNVPATSVGFTYDGGITISYVVTGNIAMASISRYWKINNSGVVTGFGNGGSGLSDNLVDNSGILTFNSSPFQVPNPQGVTIFPQ